jgi:hypothetical protein
LKTIKDYRMSLSDRGPRRKTWLVFLSFLVLLSPARELPSLAQTTNQQTNNSVSQTEPKNQIFRLDRLPVEGGAELITLRARLDGLKHDEANDEWTPLVSVPRDTLGDSKPENDRLRYLWDLTYTTPTLRQRLLGAVPFLYFSVGSKKSSSAGPPLPLMDLSSTDHDVWEKIFWSALQNILLDPYGTPVRASTRSYRRNIGDYRKTHIIRAVSILSLYQALKGEPIFSDAEMQEVQARLLLTDKLFGGIVDDLHLQRFYQKEATALRDERGHNWELLRQQAEANGLYFEPLEMPDGSPTHAMLWIDRQELNSQANRRFEGRFLNIADPWTDKRLLNWEGYVETRYIDDQNRPIASETPGARSVEMIPLALYGLDHPKIPALLVDFRDSLNPKRREMSRRVLQDVMKNILAVSRFGDLPYFLGRAVFDFTTGRRGMDVNQPARLRSYSQLKLLLALRNSLQPTLRQEINERLARVSLNPVENDLEAEALLARKQYEALMVYARRIDGLAAKIDRDRRTEMTAFEHGRKAPLLFKLANILSFGRYVHRESPSPQMIARLDTARSLAYHIRFLREVSRSSPQVEVAWNLDDVKRSLHFVAEQGAAANAKAVEAVAEIFARTQDDEARRVCLDSLSRINSERARTELTRISQDKDVDQVWRDLSAQYLEKPAASSSPIVVSTTKAGSN